MLLYGGLIVCSNDLGGLLNLVLIPAISIIVGLAIGLVVFIPVGLVAEFFNFRIWDRVVAVLLILLTTLVIVGWAFVGTLEIKNRGFLVLGSVCLYVVAGLFLHLCCLALCRRMLSKLKPA